MNGVLASVGREFLRFLRRLNAPLLQVTRMYNWEQVAQRTRAVYELALSKPCSGDLRDRVGRLRSCGPVFGLIAVLLAALDLLWYRIVQVLDPVAGIDVVVDASERLLP